TVTATLSVHDALPISVYPRIGRIFGNIGVHHDPAGDCTLGLRPVGDRLADTGVGDVHRLHKAEPSGMRRINLERVARVVTVHGRSEEHTSELQSRENL